MIELAQVKQCHLCQAQLPLPCKPIVQLSNHAKLLIIGQAPGLKAHQAGMPFADASGKRLRAWLGLSESEFYDPQLVAIMPISFCYPGKGKSGDLPPMKPCAPFWHDKLLAEMDKVALTILLGRYAINHYLPAEQRQQNLAELVKQQTDNRVCKQWALPHPSPRNIRWFKQNPWFEQQTVSKLQQAVAALW